MSADYTRIANLLSQMLSRSRGRVSPIWAIAVVVLCGVYLAFEPALEERLGFDLPGVHAPRSEQVEVVDRRNQPTPPRSTKSDGAPAPPPTKNSRQPGAEGAAKPTTVLRQVGRDLVSPAGLRYTRGSEHGHRIDHLMAHTRDEPEQPGSHGVFDSQDRDEVVLLVDEAYELALAKRHTQIEEEGGRTVYTVDLARIVGFVGGQSGNRRGRPKARHLRLVVEEDRLITAFPIIP